MKQFRVLRVTAISSLIAGAALLSHHAVAQQKSPQELLVGAWRLISADSVRTDGTKVSVFG